MEELLSWTEVDGWLSDDEGRVLRALAVGARVLELGSYLGRSTVCMAQVARIVVSVDHHRGDPNTGPADTRERFMENLYRFGVEDKVDTYSCTLTEFPLDAIRHPFDLAFVDVYHDEATTAEAIRVALKAVRPGGVIAWHDADRPGVITAIHKSGLVPMARVGSLEWAVHI